MDKSDNDELLQPTWRITQVTLKIDCNSAAFKDCESLEVSRILRVTADRVFVLGLDGAARYGGYELKDVDGKVVGCLDAVGSPRRD